MFVRGLLLSCLAHLVLAWGLWQGEWMADPVGPSSGMKEAVFVALFQTATPVNARQADTPPVAKAPLPPEPEPAPAAVVADPAPVAAAVSVPVPKARAVPQSRHTPVRRAEPSPAPVQQPVTTASGTGAGRAEPQAIRPTSPDAAAGQGTAVAATAAVIRPAAPSRPSYAQRLTRRIEQYKTYPRRARERGLSGEVRFSVRVDDAGEMLAFHWLEGHQAFRRSTLQAVRRALPYPPDAGQAPVSIQIRMIYSLQDRI